MLSRIKFFFVGFLLLLSVSIGAKVKTNSNASPETKLAQITELAANSKGHVISLDDATYAYYAVSRPRPYTLFVFLTAANKKYKCTICEVLDHEFKLLAESYAAGIKKTKGTENVFFIKLDWFKCLIGPVRWRE